MTEEKTGVQSVMDRYSHNGERWVYHGGLKSVELPPGSLVEPGKNYRITFTQEIPGEEKIVHHFEAYLESVIAVKGNLKGDLVPANYRYNFRRTDQEGNSSLTYLTTDGKNFQVPGFGIVSKFTQIDFEALSDDEKSELKGTALRQVRG